MAAPTRLAPPAFQADYARDCWRRLSSRPAVAPVVARATRVLDVPGAARASLRGSWRSYWRIAAIVGLDVSSDAGGARAGGELA